MVRLYCWCTHLNCSLTAVVLSVLWCGWEYEVVGKENRLQPRKVLSLSLAMGALYCISIDHPFRFHETSGATYISESYKAISHAYYCLLNAEHQDLLHLCRAANASIPVWSSQKKALSAPEPHNCTHICKLVPLSAFSQKILPISPWLPHLWWQRLILSVPLWDLLGFHHSILWQLV